MTKLAETLQVLALKTAFKSVFLAGVAVGYSHSADLARQDASGEHAEASPMPEPVLELEATQPEAAGPEVSQPVEPPLAPRKSRSAEVMAPVFDLLRERKAWMIDTEIMEALHQRGIDVSPQVLRRVLTAGVRVGHLERRGDSFRTAPLVP